jgi:hypothetical protein
MRTVEKPHLTFRVATAGARTSSCEPSSGSCAKTGWDDGRVGREQLKWSTNDAVHPPDGLLWYLNPERGGSMQIERVPTNNEQAGN